MRAIWSPPSRRDKASLIGRALNAHRPSRSAQIRALVTCYLLLFPPDEELKRRSVEHRCASIWGTARPRRSSKASRPTRCPSTFATRQQNSCGTSITVGTIGWHAFSSPFRSRRKGLRREKRRIRWNPGFSHPVHQEYLPPQLKGKASFLEEAEASKVWDEGALREWERLDNGGKRWEGRPSWS